MKKEHRERIRDAWRRLRGGELTPARAAFAVGIGIAIGVLPLWGVHWALVLAICLPLRQDAGVAYLASNISLPFIAPFITFAEIMVGARIVHGSFPTITPDDVKNVQMITLLRELAIGSLVVAVAGGIAFGSLAYAVTALVRRRRAR